MSAKTDVDQTDARAYVEESARDLIAELGRLEEVACDRHELDDDELAAIDIDPAGDTVEQAEERLYEYPLAVESVTTFEVVLGCGGPTRSLCFECGQSDPMESDHPRLGAPGEIVYTVERVYYRYSWSGSAELELTGADREVAEAFARRVVPELAD